MELIKKVYGASPLIIRNLTQGLLQLLQPLPPQSSSQKRTQALLSRLSQEVIDTILDYLDSVSEFPLTSHTYYLPRHGVIR